MNKKIYLFFLCFLLIPSISYATVINCGDTISSSGYYEFTSDQSYSGTCITLGSSVSNVDIDLNGHTLTDGVGGSNSGIIFSTSGNYGNLSIYDGTFNNYYTVFDGGWNYGGSPSSLTNLTIENITFSNTNDYDIYIGTSSGTDVNLVNNSYSDKIYLSGFDNINYYGNYISSANQLSFNGYTTLNIPFNTGNGTVGNFWGDFTCSNPSNNISVVYNYMNYTICNGQTYNVNGISDNSTLLLMEALEKPADPQIILTPISTPTGTINVTSILINISADSEILECRLNWNGTWLNTMTESGNYCYINQSGSFNNSYDYYVEVTGLNTAINTTSTYSITMQEDVITPPSSEPSGGGNSTNSTSSKLASVFPANGLVSIFITLILIISNLFFN